MSLKAFLKPPKLLHQFWVTTQKWKKKVAAVILVIITDVAAGRQTSACLEGKQGESNRWYLWRRRCWRRRSGRTHLARGPWNLQNRNKRCHFFYVLPEFHLEHVQISRPNTWACFPLFSLVLWQVSVLTRRRRLRQASPCLHQLDSADAHIPAGRTARPVDTGQPWQTNV